MTTAANESGKIYINYHEMNYARLDKMMKPAMQSKKKKKKS